MHLEITTIIGCKNMCDYCPQELLIKSYKKDIRKLTFENFKKLLKNVPKDFEIHFSGFSESFLNNESSKMMKYSIEEGYGVVLYTTLVGFNDNDVDILSGLTLPFKSVNFHRFNGFGYNEIEFNKKMVLFMSKIKSIRFSNGTVGYILSRAGNLESDKYILEDKYRLGKFECASFYNNVVLPNGEVYLCCMDYGLNHHLGNLYENNLMDLDRSEIFELSNKEDSDIICRKCIYFKNKVE